MTNCEDCEGYNCNWHEPDILDKRYCPRFEITAWHPSHIYPTATIGFDVSIGRFAEVGNNVWIGNHTRVGKGAFIPEGVTIGKDVFIGPHACFSNDMYPPSPKEKWKKTLVMEGAKIGANVSVRPGVTIGKEALIGMGAVVTRQVPAKETWAGVPAKNIEKTPVKRKPRKKKETK
jgi:acetyltransferase-like isoleucine patch superfamily enzyme